MKSMRALHLYFSLRLFSSLSHTHTHTHTHTHNSGVICNISEYEARESQSQAYLASSLQSTPGSYKPDSQLLCWMQPFSVFYSVRKGEFRERTTQPMYFPSLHCKNVHRHDKKKCTTQDWNFSYSSTFSSLARENDHKYGRGSTNAVKFHQVTRGFGFLFSSFTSTKHTAAAFQILSHNSQNTWRNIHFGLCVNVFMV